MKKEVELGIFGGKWGGRRNKRLEIPQELFKTPEEKLVEMELGVKILDVLESEEPIGGVMIGGIQDHHCTEHCKSCHAKIPVREIDLIRVTESSFSQPDYFDGIQGRIQITELDIHNMTIHNSFEGSGSVHGFRRIDKNSLLRVLFGY